MGLYGPEMGIQDSVHKLSPSSLQVSNSLDSLCSKFGALQCIKARGRDNAIKTGDRSSFPRFRGFLQPAFRGDEGERRLAAGSGCIGSEQVCAPNEVYDGITQIGPEVYPQGRLDVLHRPSGRLLSDSGTSRIPQIPEVRVRWCNLPVQSPMFRVEHGTSGVYQGLRLRREDHSLEGFSRLSLPRRLAIPRTIVRSSSEGEGIHFESRCEVGSRFKPGKVPAHPSPRGDISGHENLDCEFLGFSNTETSRQLSCSDRKISILKAAAGEAVPGSSWPYVVPGVTCSRLPTSQQTFSNPPETSVASSGQSGLFNRGSSNLKERVNLVEQPTEVVEGDLSGIPNPRSEIVHGRVNVGVGSFVRYPSGSREMVTSGVSPAYQSPRVEGNSTRTPTLAVRGLGESNCSRSRQFYSINISKEGRGNEINRPILDGQRGSPLGGGEQRHNPDLFCPRTPECSSRCTQQKGGNLAERVVPSSPGLQTDLGMVGHTNDRPFRHSPQFQAPSVCLPNKRSSGMDNRCLQCNLEQSFCLCFSPLPLRASGHQSTQSVQTNENDLDRSMVAKAAVVPRGPGVVLRRTTSITTTPGPSKTALCRCNPQRAFFSSSNRVATLERRFKARGYSSLVAKRMARSVRPSSNYLYQIRWRTFRKWCIDRKVSAADTPRNDVAEFLIHLVDAKHLSLSAVKGYRAVISSVQPWVGKDEDFSTLIKSFEKDHPKRSAGSLSWNLDVVLKYLCSGIFEPLSSSSLRNLTLKTLFLLALASAKRVSELQALSKVVGFRGEDCIVKYVDVFVAKTESLENPIPRSFIIKGLAPLTEGMQERLLCPVRCLKYYLDRIENLRGSHSRLFCSLSNPAKPLSKNGMSFLLKSLIRDAHINFSPNDERILKVKAHDIRSMATSLAFKKNIALDKILEAANWRTKNIFASVYLKDFVFNFKDLYALGPLVAAQSVIA